MTALIPDDPSARQLYVFRKVRNALPGEDLKRQLAAELHCLRSRPDALTDALVRGGELECGLADAGHPSAASAMRLLDRLAILACSGGRLRPAVEALTAELERIAVPAVLRCSYPEGFSYYALHPLDYAERARELLPAGAPAAVVGIRSVGTVLSAVVAAALGQPGERITVRPEGEPYQRTCRLSPSDRAWIARQLQRGATFFIADEGPGFSGSTLLAAAAALLEAGVPRSRILVLCSRFLDPTTLGANQRVWCELRVHSVGHGRRLPPGRLTYLAGGIWRARLFAAEPEWPACWTTLERVKLLDRDRLWWKFEGFGRYGGQVRQRAELLAAAGFAPALLGWEQGYAAYEVVDGRALSPGDATREVLRDVARYCAFRAGELPSSAAGAEQLRHLLEVNLAVEFGDDAIPLPSFAVVRGVLPDAAMRPHEWVRASDGRLLKTDGADHADAHLLPGPTDIAWDLAATIAEWQLSPAQAASFLDAYRRASGDDAAPRLPAYQFAYDVFRLAYSRQAAAAMAPAGEARALWRDYLHYRARVEEQVEFLRPNLLAA